MGNVVDDILEHHGVRGMKWGQRSRSQKAEIVGAGVASYLLGKEFTRHFNMSRGMNTVVVGAATVAGINAARGYLNKFGERPISSIKK